MLVSSTAVTPYLEDSSGYHGEADQVFLPSTLEELLEIVGTISARGIPLTVAGAGTGLTGARVPHGGSVVSLERFRKIEIGHGSARCGPGALLRDLQAAAGRSKQFFGPNPTEDSASIGGIISTNAGGARGFHYGSVRRHVLSLEVVFMDGGTKCFTRGDKVDFPFQTVRLPATTKNSAGYYLKPEVEWVDLLAGSEGTLGIVIEAELKLVPEPVAVLSGIVFFPSDELALDAVDMWRASVPELRLLEFMDVHALRLVQSRYPEIPEKAGAALFVEQNLDSEDSDEVDEWTERLRRQQAWEEDSWFGLGAADRERFRAFRHALATTVVDRARRAGFPKFGTDLAVPVQHHRQLYDFYKRRCEEDFPGMYTIYGHVGDGNNHVNLMPSTPEEAKRAEALMYEFARFVVSLGGTVAAEHGIGKLKTGLLKLMYTSEEIAAMKAIKQRLDPDWLLGQGTIFDL